MIVLLFMVPTLHTVQADEFPIATNPDTAPYLNPEISVSAAFDGKQYLVGIQDSLQSISDPYDHTSWITAQFVDALGALVGGRISIGSTGGTPSLAFDGTNYLMVWEDDGLHATHIYGQFISKTGTLVGSQITIGAGSDMHLGFKPILYDGKSYFVVWEDRIAPYWGYNADVFGQFIAPSGSLLGEPIPVSTVEYGQRMPTLSFDGTNILVAWVDGRNHSACYIEDTITYCFESDVYGQFVTKSPGGTPGSLSGSNFLINASPLPRDNPIAVAFDGTNYFVAFEEETTLPNVCPPGGCKWDIYGQFVTKTGVPTGSEIVISNTTPDHHWPGLAFDGTNYLVTWTENFVTAEAAIKGRLFNKLGVPASSEFPLSSPSEDNAPWYAVPLYDGHNYFLVVNRGKPLTDGFEPETYANQDVYGTFVSKSPIPETPSDPSPLHGAMGLSTSLTLSWAPTPNATSYDVYFGTSTNPPLVGNVASPSYPVSGLTPKTLYYWKVVAKNDCGGNSTSGPVWNFSTISLSLVSPNGGEAWTVGTPHVVSWTYSGAPGTKVRIELLKGGLLIRKIASSVSNGIDGNGSKIWKVPSKLIPDIDYTIRITSTSDETMNDVSDTPFRIDPPSVNVTSPNNGDEIWAAGSTQTISWTYLGNPGSLKIELFKGGVFSQTIASSVSKGKDGAGSKIWTIPSTLEPGSDYAIRITSKKNGSWTDTSDKYFAISE